MIINIEPGTFGTIRNGDLIAICNVVEHLRKINNNPKIRFHMKPGSISNEKYVQDFHSFLIAITDYFSAFEGTESLPWRKVNVWDFRDISGDLVKIPNVLPMQKKIVIFPLFDAPYNQWRNWPRELLKNLIEKYSTEEYKDYIKIICSREPAYYGEEWINSTDFMANIQHIMEAEIFIGGDTGTTHFAFALDKGPKELLYYGSSRALVHTLPFYLLEGKGKMSTYWLDFEGSKWNN
jgi:hypothetical protein